MAAPARTDYGGEADAQILEAAMGIMFSERRKLCAIEQDLVNAAPILADRFLMFAELCGDEDMPRTEKLTTTALLRGVVRADRRAAHWTSAG